MKKQTLLALMFAMAGAPIVAVEVGQTYEQVIAELGTPPSKMEMGGALILNYPESSVKLRDGKVVSVKAVTASSSVTTLTTPEVPLGHWTTDYAAAMAQAKKDNCKVVLFFTGSDWCGWCKRLDAEILSTSEFTNYARGNLLLVKLDFPRSIAQSDKVKAQNRFLQEKHRIGGYPTLVVLDSSGTPIGQLGYQKGGPKPFLKALKAL
jgi:protein disulfide-isomerase